jgi:hypothetical protein
MAIMGIPQALKLIEGPIDALARLPQQELMAMAQRSPSLLKVLPIVLNEKAEEAQRSANMAALAQGTPPSVTEQNMAINAQAEAQPMMQQPMAPTDAGLASLPVEESNYAGGGIVAFDDGGEVLRYQNQGLVETDPSSSYYGPGLVRAQNPATNLSDYVRQYQSLMAPYRQLSEEEKAAMAIKGRSPEEIKQQNYMRLIEAGLGIMGGTSPYAFTNIGQGSQAALKGYAEDVKERRKEDLALTQAKADMARRRREEQMADVTGGIGLFKEAQAEDRYKLDRDIRKYVADNPQDLVIAKAIKKPNESLDEAITRLINLKKTDEKTYNATAALFGKAMSDTTEALKAAESPGGILYRIRTNFDWVKATYPEVKTPAQALELYEKERKAIITRGIRDFRDTTGIDPSLLGRASGFGVAGPKEGQTSKDLNGKPIIYKSGQWVYQ